MLANVWIVMSLLTWLLLIRFMYYSVMARSAEEAWKKARVTPAAYSESSRAWRELVDEIRDDCRLCDGVFSTMLKATIAFVLAMVFIAVVTALTWPVQLLLLMLFHTKWFEKRVFKRK